MLFSTVRTMNWRKEGEINGGACHDSETSALLVGRAMEAEK